MDSSRPSDHVSNESNIASPELGVIGWLRWIWRSLTSMRTALILLLLLAAAAIPGSAIHSSVSRRHWTRLVGNSKCWLAKNPYW